MKLLYITSLFVLLGSSGAFGQKVIDQVAAQVGENAILLSDIQAQKIQAAQAGMTLTPELDCNILEELLYQSLLINQAKLDSLSVTPQQVDAEMESRIRVIEDQIGGRDKMEAFYGQTIGQIKDKFRSVIYDQLLAQEMERTITADVQVTPREVETFYRGIPVDSLPLINMQMSFQQIVLYPEITFEDRKRAFNFLEGIRKDIVNNGKSFATQARIHSMDPGSKGDGGTVSASKGMMVKPFESTVFSLSPGQVSDVFETEYGYHIVMLEDRKGDDYTCRHILITPEFASNSIEEAAYRMDSCYQRLKANEITWEEAVLEYSNDEATRMNKGIITNPMTGEQLWDSKDLNEIDQQIYLLTNTMEPGDISQPNLYTNMFERKQGIRIARMMSKRDPHRANLTDDYSLIQRAAEGEKKQKIIDKWILSKIGSTYIRINSPYDECSFRNPWIKKQNY